MTIQELRNYIRFNIQESIEMLSDVDYDNLKFLPEHEVDFSNPETINKCSTFNVNDLKKQRSWAAKVRYLDNCLPKLGSGSGRVVYLLEPTKVIKLAKNDKGIAQNEVEAGMMKSSQGMYSNILAQIIDYDDDYLWIEMEVAKKLDAKTFKNATGISWKEFSKYIWYYDMYMKGFNKYINEIPEEVQENEFFSNVVDVAGGHNLSMGDFNRASTYGVVLRDSEPQVVIVDMGLTKRVYDKHYERKPKRNSFYN